MESGIHLLIITEQAGLTETQRKQRVGQKFYVTQSATTNCRQQQVTNNLERHFMLSFTYTLNKQLNPMGGMRKRGGGRLCSKRCTIFRIYLV